MADDTAQPMHISIVTLFPEFFEGPLQISIPARAIAGGQLQVDTISPRAFATNVHRTVDDTPYGGGAGMVMRAPELQAALDHVRAHDAVQRKVVLMSPQGATLRQPLVRSLVKEPGLIVVCGRYEGIDERFITQNIDLEISIGDVILSGGEPAAFLLIDAMARLLDGVVGNERSIIEESFQTGLLEHPHFTRPRMFNEQGVPDVLCSGHHGQIEKWRRKVSLLRTKERRPDLWDKLVLTPQDQKLLRDPKIVVDPRWVDADRRDAPHTDLNGKNDDKNDDD